MSVCALRYKKALLVSDKKKPVGRHHFLSLLVFIRAFDLLAPVDFFPGHTHTHTHQTTTTTTTKWTSRSWQQVSEWATRARARLAKVSSEIPEIVRGLSGASCVLLCRSAVRYLRPPISRPIGHNWRRLCLGWRFGVGNWRRYRHRYRLSQVESRGATRGSKPRIKHSDAHLCVSVCGAPTNFRRIISPAPSWRGMCGATKDNGGRPASQPISNPMDESSRPQSGTGGRAYNRLVSATWSQV